MYFTIALGNTLSIKKGCLSHNIIQNAFLPWMENFRQFLCPVRKRISAELNAAWKTDPIYSKDVWFLSHIMSNTLSAIAVGIKTWALVLKSYLSRALLCNCYLPCLRDYTATPYQPQQQRSHHYHWHYHHLSHPSLQMALHLMKFT